MSEIALRNVCKQFDSEHYGVKDFNLDIHDKEFVIFVGPSGCGKSTTLRIIAGLEEITDGELWIDGELSNYLEPKERGMSMVFQNYALYPNMTVYGNMAYALKIRKLPKDEIDRKVHEVAKILEIEQLLDRRPAALSGGQKQRVAIGSAIIRKPKAFLMDEPLSNLDAKLRAQMRVELVKLHKQLDTTIIYVTHDQTEAMTLGTKIVVMKDGLIQQVGAPQSIYDNPVNLFVAGFLGSPSMNFFRCTVKAEENNRTALLLDDAKTVKKVYLDGTRGKQIADRYNGRHVILGIRPEDIYELDEAKKLGIENESVDVDEPVVNKYTAEGRKEIHKQLETVDIERVHELMRNPISNETVEFNDNCVSLFVAQRGKCAICKLPLTLENMRCVRKIPKSCGGDDKYNNLIIVHKEMERLIKSQDNKEIKRILNKYKLESNQRRKVNTIRKNAGLEEIDVKALDKEL